MSIGSKWRDVQVQREAALKSQEDLKTGARTQALLDRIPAMIADAMRSNKDSICVVQHLDFTDVVCNDIDMFIEEFNTRDPVSYTHLRAHETL